MKRLSRIAALGCLAASLFNVRLLHAAECEYMIPISKRAFASGLLARARRGGMCSIVRTRIAITWSMPVAAGAREWRHSNEQLIRVGAYRCYWRIRILCAVHP